MIRRPIPFALSALVAASLLVVPVSAGTATRYAIEEDQVLIGFSAQLGAQKQVATLARSLEGNVQLVTAGAQIKLSVPVSSLSSGSVLVDAALRTALDAEQFPTIDLDATTESTGGKSATLHLSGTLHVHGGAVPLSVPVKVVRDGALAFVHAEFPVRLSALGVARPNIAGAQVGDEIQVTVDARLHAMADGPAVAAF